MLPSFEFETGDLAPNPIPVKAMLRHLGWGVGQCRLPLGDAPDWVDARAPEVWAALRASLLTCLQQWHAVHSDSVGPSAPMLAVSIACVPMS